jgi:hypothetical protein
VQNGAAGVPRLQVFLPRERLERIVGETHARFPSRSAPVIDLLLDDEHLDLCLKRPAEWWALCYPLRNASRWIRLTLPAGAPVLVRVKQVLKRYPETLFWVDPFRHGPQPGWQGHVRLAEWPNVMLTTLGLFPGFSAWTAEQAEEALAFVVGEVGAARLLYATGGGWDDLVSGRDRPAPGFLGFCEDKSGPFAVSFIGSEAAFRSGPARDDSAAAIEAIRKSIEAKRRDGLAPLWPYFALAALAALLARAWVAR